MRSVQVVGHDDREEDLLSDKGTLADLAYLLRRVGGGPARAVVGGIASLGVVAFALVFGDERGEALPFAVMALWCFLVAWLVRRHASD